MGMFDSFYNVPIACPKCGQGMLSEEFQTKDLDNFLNSYYFPCTVTDQLNYFHFYAFCPSCKEWIEPKVILEKGFTVRIETDDGRVLWELNKLEALVKLSNERERFRQESQNRKSFSKGLAAFIWKHHPDKREELFKLLREHLDESGSSFEEYTVRSCYNPGSYVAGIIGGPQNYCWKLEGKTDKDFTKDCKEYNEKFSKLPVGPERNAMVYALVWTIDKGIEEEQ